MKMRQLTFAILALLILSGCKTSGFNPLKLETEQSWNSSDGVLHFVQSLAGRVDK
jgi:outer membrane biogenesis lipoprotein LolB